MNNTDILFIRACKSKSPEKRLASVYRRRYGKYPNYEIYITNILTRICEEHNLISISKLILELNPETDWKYQDERFENKIYKILLSTIRLSEISKFPDFKITRKFK